MRNDGYNTVRVLLSYTGLQQNQTQPGLDATYMNNFKDFLGLAKNNNMKVIITASRPRNYKPIADQVPYPSNMPYVLGNPNIQFLHQGTIIAYKQFWRDLINNIKGTDPALLDAVFAYEIWSEPLFNHNLPPFSLGSGTITVAEGGTYDISDAQQMTAMEDNSIAYFANQIYDAIRPVDPQTLITVGVCCPGTQFARLLAVDKSKVDYLDIHLYPGDGGDGSTSLERLNRFLAAAEIEKRDKSRPIIAGEFGVTYQTYPTSTEATAAAVEMQTVTCSKGFSGWMLWTWDTFSNEQPTPNTSSFRSALAENETLNKVLAPIYRPDPCSNTTCDDCQNSDVFLKMNLDNNLSIGETATKAVD
ncbi:MAG: cellulase family glycosylhydrolase, partial [Candidatus Aenigmarchaeota archaeon]|nr:cellulase family glycosylhydrolase [Candidatus Aenigmarchaeota archaeon]